MYLLTNQAMLMKLRRRISLKLLTESSLSETKIFEEELNILKRQKLTWVNKEKQK